MGQQAGGYIAKISAGDTENRFGTFRQLRDGLKIVTNLRQQSCDINRVGGVEPKCLHQMRVVKGLFDQFLAGIEIIFYSNGPDVAAKGTKQFFL